MTNNLNSTQNLVHPDWEILDPTPDIYSLFPLFDRKFFQSRLSCVQLEWSKKMYNCAGICYQRSNRLGKSCIIRLSEPLLKLRPRKDLIQTLLHEMIHAYCFVLGIREGNGGHGPTFKKIMNGINKIAGTNITVYHTFHDEVDLYKTHWWKCNGPCQHKHPFYGLVKRTTNRKPGSYDFWWQEHKQTCGGEFIKIREPSPKRKRALTNKENIIGSPQTSNQSRSQDAKSKTNNPSSQKNVISNYFNNSSTSTGSSPKKPTYIPGAKPNFGGGTLVLRKPPTTQPRTVTPKVEQSPASSSRKVATATVKTPPEGNLRNVKQFKDLSSGVDEPPKRTTPPIPVFTGTGFILGSAGSAGERRSRLLDKFPVATSNRSNKSGNIAKPTSPKKPRIELPPKPTSTSSTNDPTESVLLSDDSDDMFDEIDLTAVGSMKTDRTESIRKEIVDSFENDEMDEILLIDNEYDDELADVEQLSIIDDTLRDPSVIDELFNESDELIDDFNRTNAKIKIEKPDDEIVCCPMCLAKMVRAKIGDHLNQCYTLISGGPSATHRKSTTLVPSVPSSTIHDTNQPSTSKATPPARATPTATSSKSQKKPTCDLIAAQEQLLRDCGYNEQDIANVLEDMSAESMPAPSMAALQEQMLRDCGYTEEDIRRVLDDASPEEALSSNDVEFVSAIEDCDCPICGKKVALNLINQHIDLCLMK
ncbi:DNA-dependent metalloprotease SPRTN-like [Anopheles maculipalpis]|uniref:DNA-dependent metalloprotease SPRTN-like n=1 Tax=Anopheles maculipalpis TaxID=1496333 RepID=UPI00215916DA|nr:DNA-dependent metalloprotease SPRTN-like [Anopheles maculipalpis]